MICTVFKKRDIIFQNCLFKFNVKFLDEVQGYLGESFINSLKQYIFPEHVNLSVTSVLEILRGKNTEDPFVPPPFEVGSYYK